MSREPLFQRQAAEAQGEPEDGKIIVRVGVASQFYTICLTRLKGKLGQDFHQDLRDAPEGTEEKKEMSGTV